jgi:hypothetical protein
MVMERINGFSKLGRSLLDRFQGSAPPDAKEAAASREVRNAGHERPAGSQDTAEISPQAHRLMALRQAMESASEVLASLPEVREDRVAAVRARLDKGFYNSVEVRTRVAERLELVARKLEVL